MSNDLKYAFLRESKGPLEELATDRTVTTANYRAGYGDATLAIPRPLLLKLELLGCPCALEALKKLSVNGYWLLKLSRFLVAATTPFPYTSHDVALTARTVRTLYRDQRLLRRVVKAPWEDLLPVEYEKALRDGLIVIDRTWVHEADEQSVNPVFSG